MSGYPACLCPQKKRASKQSWILVLLVYCKLSMASCRCYQDGVISFRSSATHFRTRKPLTRPVSLQIGRSSTPKQSFSKSRHSVVNKRWLCRAFAQESEAKREPQDQGPNWKLLLWGTLDVTATLGSVGGAVAFILTQEAMLIGLPLVLPLLALYASRRRESLKVEVRS